MQFYFNPLNPACKSLTGAFPRNEIVTFRIYWRGSGEMPHDLDASFVYFQDGKDRTALSMRRTDDEGGTSPTGRCRLPFAPARSGPAADKDV